MTRPPPRSPLFPSTTLFRSRPRRDRHLPPADRLARHAAASAQSFVDGRHGEDPGEADDDRHRRHGQRLRSEEHTSELQSHVNLVCRLLLEKKKKKTNKTYTL